MLLPVPLNLHIHRKGNQPVAACPSERGCIATDRRISESLIKISSLPKINHPIQSPPTRNPHYKTKSLISNITTLLNTNNTKPSPPIIARKLCWRSYASPKRYRRYRRGLGEASPSAGVGFAQTLLNSIMSQLITKAPMLLPVPRRLENYFFYLYLPYPNYLAT